MKIVSSLGAPTARGHHSQAVVHGGIVYVAGQLPIVPGEPEKLAGHEPARTVVPVSGLHYGYLVEMDAIAALRGS